MSFKREGCRPSTLLPKPTAPDDTRTTCLPSRINRAIVRTIGPTRSAHIPPCTSVTVLVPSLMTMRRATPSFWRVSFSPWSAIVASRIVCMSTPRLLSKKPDAAAVYCLYLTLSHSETSLISGNADLIFPSPWLTSSYCMDIGREAFKDEKATFSHIADEQRQRLSDRTGKVCRRGCAAARCRC